MKASLVHFLKVICPRKKITQLETSRFMNLKKFLSKSFFNSSALRTYFFLLFGLLLISNFKHCLWSWNSPFQVDNCRDPETKFGEEKIWFRKISQNLKFGIWILNFYLNYSVGNCARSFAPTVLKIINIWFKIFERFKVHNWAYFQYFCLIVQNRIKNVFDEVCIFKLFRIFTRGWIPRSGRHWKWVVF